jgi:hypothetical protein
MYNPITKTARYLRREYPMTASMTLGTAALGAAFCLIPGAPFLAPVFMPLGFGGFTWGFATAAHLESRPSSNCDTVNDIKLVGSPRDVASVHMMQELVKSYTKKLQHMPELPPRTQRKIAAHLADIAPCLKRLRMYDVKGEPVTSFTFTRQMYNSAGKLVNQTVASLASGSVEVSAPALAPPAPQKALAAPPRPAAEFASLSKKVDDVAERVERLENPPVVRLDKPAPHKPL